MICILRKIRLSDNVQWNQTKVSVLVCIQTKGSPSQAVLELFSHVNHSAGKDQIAVDIQRICTGYDNGDRDFITKV